jgi:hypothetical protein
MSAGGFVDRFAEQPAYLVSGVLRTDQPPCGWFDSFLFRSSGDAHLRFRVVRSVGWQALGAPPLAGASWRVSRPGT